MTTYVSDADGRAGRRRVGNPRSRRRFSIPGASMQPWWIILPNSTMRRLWELWMLAPMMYVAFITPFRIFFNAPASVSAPARQRVGSRAAMRLRRERLRAVHRHTRARSRTFA